MARGGSGPLPCPLPGHARAGALRRAGGSAPQRPPRRALRGPGGALGRGGQAAQGGLAAGHVGEHGAARGAGGRRRQSAVPPRRARPGAAGCRRAARVRGGGRCAEAPQRGHRGAGGHCRAAGCGGRGGARGGGCGRAQLQAPGAAGLSTGARHIRGVAQPGLGGARPGQARDRLHRCLRAGAGRGAGAGGARSARGQARGGQGGTGGGYDQEGRGVHGAHGQTLGGEGGLGGREDQAGGGETPDASQPSPLAAATEPVLAAAVAAEPLATVAEREPRRSQCTRALPCARPRRQARRQLGGGGPVAPAAASREPAAAADAAGARRRVPLHRRLRERLQRRPQPHLPLLALGQPVRRVQPVGPG
mmetsp:Transcript_70638/g.210636  ORF Transcript_70638/g.210636 Transcript_70638/m.210636 type:complete len:363 (-) Transcript_70638:983-2071(-)